MILPTPIFLTRSELRELTGRVQYSAQIKVLRSMGIEHRARPDGSLAVLRVHIEQLFGVAVKTKLNQFQEPNWGALNATRS